MRAALLAAMLGALGGCSAGGPASVGGADASADAADEAACLLCSAGDAGDPWRDPSLPLGKRMVSLLDSCTGAEACHAAGSGGMTILGGQELAQIVGVRSTERPELLRVAPFDPAQSYLYLKLRGDGGIDGSAMPAGGVRDPARADLAWAWIEAGAPPP